MQLPKRKIKTSQEKVDRMIVNDYSNSVIVKVDMAGERTTKAGIIIDFTPDIQWENDTHIADAERIKGEVYTVPTKLYPDDDYLPWYTEVEIRKGDTVYFDYMDSINSVTFVVGDYEYRVLPYSALYVAVRGEQIIPLNGYNIFEDVMEEKKSDLDVIARVHHLKGKCMHVAGPIQWCNKKISDDIELDVGDIVEFNQNFKKVPLERRWYFASFDEDKLYFRAQRKEIAYNHGKETTS